MLSVINSNGRSKGWSVCSFSFSVWIYSRWMIQGRKPKQKIIKTRYWRYCMFQLQPLRNPHMGWIYLSWMKKIKTQEELINSQGTEWWLSWYRIRLQCRRPQLPTPLFWSGEFHGLYSPWVAKSQTRLSNFHFYFCWGLVWSWLRSLLVERPGMDIYLFSIMKSVQGCTLSPLY